MYECLECGRKFKTTRAAERAVDKGCPTCGGVDIDLSREQEVKPGIHTKAAELVEFNPGQLE